MNQEKQWHTKVERTEIGKMKFSFLSSEKVRARGKKKEGNGILLKDEEKIPRVLFFRLNYLHLILISLMCFHT